MRGKIVLAGLILSLSGAAVHAQTAKAPVPIREDLYCSGIVLNQAVPRSTYVITGQGSNVRLSWTDGDHVYINRGTEDGAKVGDSFLLVRPIQDTIQIDWTKWQKNILHAMGTMWEDQGRVHLVSLGPKSSVAVVDHVCDYIQRGDIALPFAARPVPNLKSEKDFNMYAPMSGKKLAMVIAGKKFRSVEGRGDIVYVNLGNKDGVRVGDYFRIFRYTGTQHETVFQDRRYAFDTELDNGLPKMGYAGYTGFGSAPKKWDYKNTPREVLGEGVVLRTGQNSATVLITFSVSEIFSGDYVELE